jgi:hypothetical protein
VSYHLLLEREYHHINEIYQLDPQYHSMLKMKEILAPLEQLPPELMNCPQIL